MRAVLSWYILIFFHENEKTLNLSNYIYSLFSYTYAFTSLFLEQVKTNKSEAVTPKWQMLFLQKAMGCWEYLSYTLIWEKQFSLCLHDCMLYLWTSKWLISNCTINSDLAISHAEYSSNLVSPFPHELYWL